jgi:hypothetical protein
MSFYTNDVSDVYDFQTSVSFYFSEKIILTYFDIDFIDDLIIRDIHTLIFLLAAVSRSEKLNYSAG